MRYFGPAVSFSGNHGANNIIIASKGDITIKSNTKVTGILFAPDGIVTIGLGNSTKFEGIIIAKEIIIGQKAEVKFKPLSEFIDSGQISKSELPF